MTDPSRHSTEIKAERVRQFSSKRWPTLVAPKTHLAIPPHKLIYRSERCQPLSFFYRSKLGDPAGVEDLVECGLVRRGHPGGGVSSLEEERAEGRGEKTYDVSLFRGVTINDSVYDLYGLLYAWRLDVQVELSVLVDPSESTLSFECCK